MAASRLIVALTLDEAADVLRAWADDPVVVTLEPDGTVMRGRLHEIDPGGIDGVLFTMAVTPDAPPTGVALALFRDALRYAELRGDELVLRQGRVTIGVRRA